MSASHINHLRNKIKQIGPWSGVRMLRNQGVSFDDAYFVMFNRSPSK